MIAGCKIESVGVKLPDKKVASSELTNQLRLSKPLKLELLTGIYSRRVCSEKEDSLTLAAEAAIDCLRHSKYNPEDIEMIISCSISKYINGLNHFYEPPLSLLIKERIGNKNAQNFDISNACAGMITGLHIARNFISRGIVKNCMVVSGEYITSLCSNAVRNIDSHSSTELASLTVGDAGAAVILTCTTDQADVISVSEILTISRYSNLCTGYQNIKNPGGLMNTRMKEIHDVSIENAPIVIENALKKAGLKISQIDHLIPHQTAKHSIQLGAVSFEKYFGEKPANVILNLKEMGNTASTSHFIAFYRWLEEKRFRKGDKIMLLSFASGLVIGVVIFTINEIIDSYGNNN
jgi:3-oxoacyl-[acyl-carrier-protein] synthase III